MKLFILSFLFSFSAMAQDCTLAITLKDSIGAATYDIFQRAGEKAQKEKCSSILFRINTPGGHLQSTRLITEHILASKIPYLCLISPAGGHAGSAGAIILQACHFSGGLTATNVGAATPILGTGAEMPEDLRNKMVNDTVSWVQGLAQLRGRSGDFAKKIVTEGMAVTSDEAVKLKGLDWVGATEADFLKAASGRPYKDAEKKDQIITVGEVQELLLDTRYKILQFISEPEWAYMLFMGALLLLYAEFSHPGLFLPGVAGAILLVLSMIAFHKMDANFGGMALMILGLAFWVAELFITSKGILGIAGTIAFLIGSFLLFDVERTGLQIPMTLIFTTVFVFGGIAAAIAVFAAKTLRQPKHDYDHQMFGKEFKIMTLNADGKTGQVEALGEIWNFDSQDPLQISDLVEVLKRENLKLIVRKKV